MNGERGMTVDTPPIPGLLDRNPAGLSPAEIAAASRPPLTLIGNRLRETNADAPLSAAQSLVLSQLSVAESMPVTELAAADGRAISTMTEIVGRLTTAGLVVKRGGVTDRRQVRVAITEEGRRALENNQRLRHETLTARIAALADHERVALAAALPALWKIAEIDPGLWPRLSPRSEPRRRRKPRTTPEI
ncbi:MarR family winged helix-turn-helix transcriptional regulator [Amycolatopsis sp.]|uniref:MarR family winged helix-turn-helix transcriptional regulator n=1 Tax=Amycolatopsis sp. TaxID=37632 RepID=UPI002CD6F76D|nr:MarR family transcriptional regulator [Amycolatopsis sp.]HVV07936.1 MarR family transcriptional regulator [Amycolatopsis sp.]